MEHESHGYEQLASMRGPQGVGKMLAHKLQVCLIVGFLSLVVAPGYAAAGNLDLAPTEDWAAVIPDDEMAELRGGFHGLAFSVLMNTTIQNLSGELDGNIDIGGEPPSFNLNGDQVNIHTQVGNFVGAHGIFQIVDLENSDFNIINNNLFVQIFVGDLAVPAITAIESMSP